jgi:hypothetical protein
MTDRHDSATRNQEQSLEAFLVQKGEFDTLLANLHGMSDDHFNADPETVLWGHVGSLQDWNHQLRQVTDAYFKRGEHAG